mmetsp:Transcript_8941/g.20544  ORF Transcript_8941/g.20544 Transcript_8941/m.20544 type:complete len:216 (+) Transcript_8941:1111-1758(+)
MSISCAPLSSRTPVFSTLTTACSRSPTVAFRQCSGLLQCRRCRFSRFLSGSKATRRHWGCLQATRGGLPRMISKAAAGSICKCLSPMLPWSRRLSSSSPSPPPRTRGGTVASPTSQPPLSSALLRTNGLKSGRMRGSKIEARTTTRSRHCSARRCGPGPWNSSRSLRARTSTSTLRLHSATTFTSTPCGASPTALPTTSRAFCLPLMSSCGLSKR